MPKNFNKMKKYLSFMAFAMMAVFSLAVVSCGDDDDDEPTNVDSDYVGTWSVQRVEGWGYDEDNSFEYVQLKSDGTYIDVQELTEEDIEDDEFLGFYTEKEKAQGYVVYRGEWSVSSNKLFLKVSTPTHFKGTTLTYDIVKKEKDKLTVSMLGITSYLIRVNDKTIEKYL